MTDRIEEDRITYFEGEFTKYGEPVIDELVLHNALVHLEYLSDSCYMLIADNGKHYWHLTIHSKGGRAKVVARVYEDNSEEQSSQLFSQPLTDEGLEKEIRGIIFVWRNQDTRSGGQSVPKLAKQISTLLQQRAEQERERAVRILDSYMAHGRYKALLGDDLVNCSSGDVEYLWKQIRQAISGDKGEE